MKRIREKLRSQSGASILLALLFFLLCSMVGASVLMAAASNAGKVNSSKEEQQKYLVLSSALRMVCGELERAAYTVECKSAESITVEDYPSGGGVNDKLTVTERAFTWESSAFTCRLPLDLLPELDALFSSKFPNPLEWDEGITQTGEGEWSTTRYKYFRKSGLAAPAATKHTLTLCIDDPDEPGLSEEVTVEVELKSGLGEEYKLILTAYLTDDHDHAMHAELYRKGGIPVPKYGEAPDKVGWEFAWIAKEVADDGP